MPLTRCITLDSTVLANCRFLLGHSQSCLPLSLGVLLSMPVLQDACGGRRCRTPAPSCSVPPLEQLLQMSPGQAVDWLPPAFAGAGLSLCRPCTRQGNGAFSSSQCTPSMLCAARCPMAWLLSSVLLCRRLAHPVVVAWLTTSHDAACLAAGSEPCRPPGCARARPWPHANGITKSQVGQEQCSAAAGVLHEVLHLHVTS